MRPASAAQFGDRKFRALKDLGVSVFAHLHDSLESDLRGTYELLLNWNNPQ